MVPGYGCFNLKADTSISRRIQLLKSRVRAGFTTVIASNRVFPRSTSTSQDLSADTHGAKPTALPTLCTRGGGVAGWGSVKGRG